IIVLLASLVDCKSKASEKGVETTSTQSSTRVEASTSAASAPHITKYTPPPGCPNADVAFAAGRSLTVEKEYGEAINAFDDAVRARPFDARIRAERGYAFLLSGDAKSANEDFAHAINLTTDKALLAQVWFNVGDAFAKLGDAEASRMAFAI